MTRVKREIDLMTLGVRLPTPQVPTLSISSLCRGSATGLQVDYCLIRSAKVPIIDFSFISSHHSQIPPSSTNISSEFDVFGEDGGLSLIKASVAKMTISKV